MVRSNNLFIVYNYFIMTTYKTIDCIGTGNIGFGRKIRCDFYRHGVGFRNLHLKIMLKKSPNTNANNLTLAQLCNTIKLDELLVDGSHVSYSTGPLGTLFEKSPVENHIRPFTTLAYIYQEESILKEYDDTYEASIRIKFQDMPDDVFIDLMYGQMSLLVNFDYLYDVENNKRNDIVIDEIYFPAEYSQNVVSELFDGLRTIVHDHRDKIDYFIENSQQVFSERFNDPFWGEYIKSIWNDYMLNMMDYIRRCE